MVTRFVIDASVAFEYLLKTPLGLHIADTIDDASLSAPELLDAEVLSALRRTARSGLITEERALLALGVLADWPIDRISHRYLARLAWEHRHNLSAYDAFYVAAARSRNVPLLTADGRLSRTSGLGIVVQNFRMG